MIALILAAGFGTRCRPLTNDKPKSLLSLGKDTVIDEQLRWLFSCKDINRVVIVSNQKFFDTFTKWRKQSPYRERIEILNDGITDEKNQLGAIGDLVFTVKKIGKLDDLLVLGSDNLFDDNLDEMADNFNDNKNITVAIHNFKKSLVSVQSNEVKLDNDGFITYYKEKPAKPMTADFVSLLYIFPKEFLPKTSKYLAEGNKSDNAGSLIEWLVKKNYKVRGFKMFGRRFDVGDIESYLITQKEKAKPV